MNHLSLIIKREYLTKVRNKSFIIMTFLSPLIMVGLFSLVAYLSQLNNDTARTISVLDESGLFIDQFWAVGYLLGAPTQTPNREKLTSATATNKYPLGLPNKAAEN